MIKSINDRLGPGGLSSVAVFSEDASGNTVLVGPDGIKGYGTQALLPTGNDQASEIEQYINDTAGDYAAVLGSGDFIIGSPLTLYSRHNYGTKWGQKGIGLGLKGQGALLAGEDKGTKRGRPTKEEKERQLKIDESIRETLSEDMQRLGLTVVK